MRKLTRWRTVITSVIAIALAWGNIPTATIQTGYAMSDLDKVNREIAQILQQKKEAKKKAIRAQAQLKYVKHQKNEVKQDLTAVIDQIDHTNIKLESLEKKISTLDNTLGAEVKKLQESETRMNNRDKLLKSRVNLLYKNGFVSYIEVLVSSTSFSDFIDRYYSIQSLVKQDQELLADNRRDRDEIAQQKESIEGHLAEIRDLYTQTGDLRDELFDKEKQKEVMITSLSKMEHDLQEVTEEQEKEVITLAKQEAELIRKKSKYELTYRGGKLEWPLPGHYEISSPFGYRTHPVSGEKNKLHTGIDIPAAKGTNIIAAEDGVVIVAQWTNGYGNTVIIDHGSNTWTLYGHIRSGGIKVKSGEKVSRGTKIAEVGSTGRSTGNHLHFEVRVNEQAINPMGYLK